MDRPARLELARRRTGKPGNGVGAGPDDQVRALTGDVRQAFTAQLSPAKLDQGIGLSLA